MNEAMAEPQAPVITREQLSQLPSVAIAELLRVWAADSDPNVAAAVGLLSAHGFWLSHEGFRRLALAIDEHNGYVWIDWTMLRNAPADQLQPYTPNEAAVLDLAIALGQDRYRFANLDATTRRLVVIAVTKAARP